MKARSSRLARWLTKTPDTSAAPPLIGSAEPTMPHWAEVLEQTATVGVGMLARTAPGTIRQFAVLAWRASPALTIVSLLLHLLAAAATTSGFLLTADAFSELLAAAPTAERLQSALPALVLVAVAMLARGLLSAAANAAESVLGPLIEQRAGVELFDGLSEVPLVAFDDADFTQLVQRARREGLSGIEQGMAVITMLLNAAVPVLSAVVAVALLHPLLALLVLLAVVPHAWASARGSQLHLLWFAGTTPATFRQEVTANLIADRENAAEVRAFNAGPVLAEEYRRTTAELTRESIATRLRVEGLLAVGMILSTLCALGSYVLLGFAVYTGRFPLALAGTAILAMLAGSRAMDGVMAAVNHLFMIGVYLDLYEQARAEIRERRLRPTGGSLPAGPELIEARDMSFRYPGAESEALQGVNLTLRRGEVVALVGENGSGKTTLAKLLTGLYLPSEGSVTWDGISTDALEPAARHDHTAVVFQEPMRWPLTAEHNIRIGRLERDDPDNVALDDAARRSGAAEVIAELPEGLQTLLTKLFQHGHDLSGGQWQRISIGRGLYRDARILIADEPTASLDAKAEQAVFAALREMSADRERITVLVTHRLANIANADRIVVLSEGKIIEQGTHAELMAAQGTYCELFTIQADAYARADAG